MEDVPPPETVVVLDEGRHRCELVVYVSKGGQVKDVRLRGPLRGTRREALKDCIELRKAAVRGGQDPALHKVREKRKDLESTVWTEKDLGGRSLEAAEGPAPVPAPRRPPEPPPPRPPKPAGPGGDASPAVPQEEIDAQVAELQRKHGLDESSATKLAAVFQDRAKLGCDISKDFDELEQHLGASNKPSALVSMKLAELRSGAPIGQCRYTGGRKDAGSHGRRVGPEAAQPSSEAGREPLLRPVGPGWKRPGQLCAVPDEGCEWLIHERQEPGGKYRPWLFFNQETGRYYQEKDSGDGYIGVGVPHDPQEHALTIRASSTSLPSRAGKKLDMAVLLPELHKTGFILKQPLEFLDRPASLLVLCDGLRNAGAATEFCAKKFHTLVLPRLAARATEWEDFELADILSEATEVLDRMLLDSPARFAGCSLAVALLIGRRLIVGALGGTRCLLCSAGGPAQPAGGRPSAASVPWRARLLAGGGAHTAANKEECLRVASAGDRVLDQGSAAGTASGSANHSLHPRSASQGMLDAITDDQERELLRVSQATNPFATLGLAPADLQEGSAAVRRIFRKRSLAVHPDKVGEASKTRAVTAFAKLEAAAKAVESMLTADASAATLLADLFAAQDSTSPAADPGDAAQMLGVTDFQEGCSIAAVKEATRQRFLGPLSQLQEVCPREVSQALRILEAAEASLARGPPALWTPPVADAAVAVTRALGCSDLKMPAPLLDTGLATHVVELEHGSYSGLALLSDSTRGLSDNAVAAVLQRHRGRPRAAALQLAIDSGSLAQETSEAIGTVCAYLDFGSPSQAGTGPPEPKRAKLAAAGKTGQTGRVRVSHVLVRWVGLKGADVEERPGFVTRCRSQVEAEKELFALLEGLLAGDAKTRGNRFKAAAVKRSECPSALNVPYADLGWLDRGTADPALEAAAFDTSIGDISDIIITGRGAHLLYRLA